MIALHYILLHRANIANILLTQPYPTNETVESDQVRRSLLEKCSAGALGGSAGDWLLVIGGTENTAHSALHIALLVTHGGPVQ